MITNIECPICKNITFVTEDWLEMVTLKSDNIKVILVICDNCGNVYTRKKEG